MRRHVYYYTHVDQPFDAAAGLLQSDPGVWLPEPGLPHGGRWLVDLDARGSLPDKLARHQAAVDVAEPSATPNALLRGITWRSVAAESWIPVLTADLELTPLSGGVCQLSLLGSYRPPLTVIGGAGDALLGHRVAEACVRRFVEGVAGRLAVANLHM